METSRGKASTAPPPFSGGESRRQRLHVILPRLSAASRRTVLDERQTAIQEFSFWRDRRVFVTGHTGFKGAWLALWLQLAGARVYGYALPPSTDPSLFRRARVDEGMAASTLGDVRDSEQLVESLQSAEPEIVFHLAAQPIVRESYRDPVSTFSTNILGTAHLLEAVRLTSSVQAVVVVTSDKAYENLETLTPYTENAKLGGRDPYSASKAGAEIVAASYRDSFLSELAGRPGIALATARAGNVIGGGDWAIDRIVPDTVRALLADRQVELRYPAAIRPWQHVLEPLSGYLTLAERLATEGKAFAEAWNFAPNRRDAKPVGWLVERIHRAWGRPFESRAQAGEHPHEATYLALDASKAKDRLDWRPRLRIAETVDWLVDWYRREAAGEDVRALCEDRLESYGNRV